MLKKTNLSSVLNETVYYLTNYFPLAFSMAACFGFRGTIGILFAALSMILYPDFINKKIMPVYISFIMLGFYIDYAFWAFIICGIFLIISAFFYNKLKTLMSSPAVQGVMIASALTATVMFTTNYFGIGATGDNVREMIKSYISLGFHPNWRGVLYGTIVMVIMITFPRKFKKLSKIISASFIAIIVTLILNLFLNPSYMTTAIAEIPLNGTTWSSGFLFNRAEPIFDYRISVPCGIALFLNTFYAMSQNDNNSRKDCVVNGVANGLIGGIFGLPLPFGINKNKETLFPRGLAAALTVIIFVVFKDFIARIPLHSCAVIIIVGAWQNVKWGELKKAFSGIVPVLFFAISAVSCLIFDLVFGIIISFLLSIVYYFINHKFLKKAV